MIIELEKFTGASSHDGARQGQGKGKGGREGGHRGMSRDTGLPNEAEPFISTIASTQPS